MKKIHDNHAWLYLLPAVTLLAMVGGLPLVTVINVSLQDILSEQSSVWVGLEWYREILTSPDFLASFRRSLFFSALVLCIELPLGILVALSMPKDKRYRSLFVVLFALPLLIPWSLIPVIWQIFLGSKIGAMLQMLIVGGMLDWKFNALHTWLVILMMDIWHWTSLVTLLCYSSLSVILVAYYQAARIDGASRWQVFRSVEFPRLRSVLSMALLLRFVDSFMVYTEVFRFNAGGPGDSTMFLAVDLGEDVFAFNYGPSAARSMICFIIILTVAWIFFRTRSRSERGRRTMA